MPSRMFHLYYLSFHQIFSGGMVNSEYLRLCFKNRMLMKRWIMMLIALVVCVGFSNAQTTDKEERANLREERRIEQERLDS